MSAEAYFSDEDVVAATREEESSPSYESVLAVIAGCPEDQLRDAILHLDWQRRHVVRSTLRDEGDRS